MGRSGVEAPRRAQYHHGDLAQALKTHAAQVIATRGLAEFSMREAAAALGVASSALYRHYADKSDLFSAVALDGFRALGRAWRDLMARSEAECGGDPAMIALARFSAGADAYVQFARDNPALFQLMYGPYGTGTFGLDALHGEDGDNPYAILSAVLDGLRDAGIISPAARPHAEVQAYAAIHGMAALLVSGAFNSASASEIAALLEAVKNNIFGGLVCGPKASWLCNPAFAHLPQAAIDLGAPKLAPMNAPPG